MPVGDPISELCRSNGTTRKVSTRGAHLDDREALAQRLPALLHDLRAGKLDEETVLYWNTLNNRDLSAEIDGLDFHDLPPAFHPYFE